MSPRRGACAEWRAPRLKTKLVSWVVGILAIITPCFVVKGSHGVTRPPAPKPTTSTTTVRLTLPSLPPPVAPLESVTTPPICADAISKINPLGRLRDAMRNTSITRQQPLDAYLVFYSDEHLSDEPAPEERRLEYVSGWDGAGIGVVLNDGGAGIWLPAGDLARAMRDLSCAWRILDADDTAQPTIVEWVSDRIGRTGKVGGDARLVSMDEWQRLVTQFQREGFQLLHVPMLVDQLWNEERDPARMRPEQSKIVAYLHKIDYPGGGWRDKVAAVRAELRASNAEAMIVSALDEVAWLLNIRGRDVPYAPLLKAFVLVGVRDLHVYAPQGKLPLPVREVLSADVCLYSNNFNCTQVHEYTAIYTELRWRATEWSKVLIPAAGTFQRGASAAIAQSVPHTKRLVQLSPIVYLKAQKSTAEAAGMRKAHLRDAVAMCTLLSYIEGMVKRSKLDEMSVARKVDTTRSTQAGYVGISMQTLVAFGPNGADPDYRPRVNANRKVFTNSTLIISSGGQYEEGTTVVSRTLHFGTASREERRAYTSVIRALSALATLQPPAALPAAHADPVARASLWASRKDYMHPTGHGVGAALNRKEDPVVIDYRQDTNLHTFKEGYFVTNEPSWYETGKYGVKLGNVLELISRPNGYLSFREATLVPYEPKLIDKTMLTEYELTWLNEYNDRIRKEVGPELKSQGLHDVYYWMTNKTVRMESSLKLKHTFSGATNPIALTHTLSAIALASLLYSCFNLF